MPPSESQSSAEPHTHTRPRRHTHQTRSRRLPYSPASSTMETPSLLPGPEQTPERRLRPTSAAPALRDLWFQFLLFNRQSAIENWQCDQSAATASGSVLKARSSADSYPARSSATEANTTTRPSSLISTCAGTVSPSTSTKSPYFLAISLILGSWLRSHEITTRLASSPNKANSGGSPFDAMSTRKPIPVAKVGSARATASPPEEQSCADSISPAWIMSIKHFCSAA